MYIRIGTDTYICIVLGTYGVPITHPKHHLHTYMYRYTYTYVYIHICKYTYMYV